MTETKTEAAAQAEQTVQDTSENAEAPQQASAAPAEPKVHPNKAAFALLSETYPDLFNLQAPKPLKIGIHVSLAEDGKLSKTKIRRALNFYVRQLAYIRAVAGGGKRFDLNGEAGEVSAEDAEHAKKRVEDIEARRAARRQERQQQRRKPPRAKSGKGASASGKDKDKPKAKSEPRKADKQWQGAEKEVQSGNPEERLNAKLEHLARRFNSD
ncbi:MAG: ProQ/FinO family protein [Natronospirillum sp.]|uniref:ProQ/FinO family protein n=1 Tax=Natronospirillum sp. TaxID=2812955 RepID=UPI0025DD1DC2|nr:ProQ/FinO family protein [Natronospirillum sp.]MCH8550696.1 ProQ/FinO family protein [Natronospirillum sp.]